MTSNYFVALPILAFSSAVMLLTPHISPRRYFFAVTVSPGFSMSDQGRAIARFYHWGVFVDVVLAAVLIYLLGEVRPGLVPFAAFVVPFAGGVAQFLAARAKARLFAVSSSIREASLSSDEDRFPRWFALALPIFAFPLAAAGYLRAHWADLPARIPVHFTIDGQADRWVDKAPGPVYGMLMANAGVLLLLLLIGMATYYGARRLPQRAAVLKLLVAMSYYFSILFTGLSLISLIGFSPLWILVPCPLLVFAILYWAYKLTRDPSMPSEVTPDDAWILGVLYVNPQDPAIFVQKRVGFGYTINMGNRMAWLFLGLFAATATVLVRVLR